MLCGSGLYSEPGKGRLYSGDPAAPKNGKAQAVIANSGNANTCNADGVEKAERICLLAAKELGIPQEDVLVASTGVIGQVLPIEPIENSVAALTSALSKEGAPTRGGHHDYRYR